MVARTRGAAVARRLATAVALLAVAALPAAASSPAPRTLVSLPGVVYAFAHDNGRIAWIETTWELRIRAVAGGAPKTIRYTNQYEERQESGPGRLALGGRRAVWLSSRGGFDIADRVYTATTAAPRPRLLEKQSHLDGHDGGYVTGIAGDASGFAYGVVEVTEIGPCPCKYKVTGGAARLVDAGTKRDLPGAPPPFLVARAGARVAVVPASVDPRPEAQPLPAARVEVRDAKTGAVVSTFSPSGPVRAITLSARVVAVLAGGRIERYDVATGNLVGATPVSAQVARELDIEGARIVFRDNRTIRLLDSASGRVSVLAKTTPWKPVAVSIEGRTVVWVETMRVRPGDISRRTFRSRIRLVLLPRA